MTLLGTAEALRLGARALPWLMAAILLYAGPGKASDIGELDLRCRSLLQRYVLDCTCTEEFLEAHLGPEAADALMRLWIYGTSDNDQRQEIMNVYLQYGRKTVDEAVMAFHRHRDRLTLYCGSAGPAIAD